MPGFTLIFQSDGLDESVKLRAEKLVESSFKTQFIVKKENLMILFRDGNHYPYEIVDHNGYLIFIEGKIYGIKPETDNEFRQKATAPQESFDLSYFQNLDGEFIVCMLEKKTGHIRIVNDFLGRLPLYQYHKRQFILSRDMYVLDKVTTGLVFDDAPMYQYMRLGYPLGNRTLYYDINRVAPSSRVFINGDKIDIESIPLHLDELEGSYTQPKPEESLYELFSEAVSQRLKSSNKNVLSLSGGLDSRLIMGEIEKSHLKIDYASFAYDNQIIKNDIEVVKKLGRHYKRSPEILELREYSPEFFDELARAKGGMNYLGMAFIVGFLKNIGSKYEMMLTGDGGDKTLPYLFPDRNLKSKELAGMILKKNAISSKRSLDSFLIFDIEEQEDLIRQYLLQLPGINSKQKYKYFLLFERTFNWLFEGEDRNRSYIWSTSPFYQPAFFKLVHSIPEQEKKNYKLFRSFADLIDPALNQIPNANWGMPLDNINAVNRMLFRQKLKSYLPKFGKGRFNDSESHKQMALEVTALMQNGYGGQLSLYADRHDLISASDETLFHLISLLKVSEMTWKKV